MKEKLIDLHLHLDGSLSLASIQKLATMQNMDNYVYDGRLSESAFNESILRKMQVDESCKNLKDYLERFAFALSFLQTAEAIEESVYTLLEECKALGMIYTEIRFAPQLHLEKGLTQREVIEAAIRGKKRSDLDSNLILCCMRSAENHEINLETIRLAAEYLDQGVCAVDLAGGEVHFPFESFALEFQLAKELGIPVTIHAGEADGPESVWLALSFGATRIGHGVRSVEDPELIKELAKRGIVLELCPTSNLHTHVFERIEEYPIRKLLDAGVKATINSDNMTVSNTNVKKELQLLQNTFKLSKEEIRQCKKHAVLAAFANEDTKQLLLNEIEKE